MTKFRTQLIDTYNITFDITIWKEQQIVWLNHLVVPKNFQRKKLGSKAMLEFCSWLDENQLNCKLLIIKESLFDFYKLFGFTKYENYLIRRCKK